MQTKRDVLLKAQQDFFSDRITELGFFRELLEEKDPKYHLINIVGIGGIGKTTLLNAYKDVCKEKDVAAAQIDFATQKSILEILYFLYRQIKDYGQDEHYSLRLFEDQTKRYLELENKLLDNGTIPINLINQFSKSSLIKGEFFNFHSSFYETSKKPNRLSTESLESLQKQLENHKTNLRLVEERISEYSLPSNVPLDLKKNHKEIISTISELENKIRLGIDHLEIITKIQDPQVALGAIYRILGKDDGDFFSNPESAFTAALLEDMKSIGDKKRFCLIFDRYETIANVTDSWFLDFFAELEKGVIVVVSGRKELSKTWVDVWMPLIRTLPLSTFPKMEIKKLLELYGISDINVIQEITDFSGGLPLAVSLAAHLVSQLKTKKFIKSSTHIDVVEKLVKVLLSEVSPDLEQALEVCSTLRWFNENSINYLAPTKLKKGVYNKLRDYEFVQRGVYGDELHDSVRDFIQEDLQHRSPAKYKELHQKAATYYEELANKNQVNHQTAKIEIIYHLLRFDEDQGMDYLKTTFQNAIDLYQIEFCYSLLDASKHINLKKVNSNWIIFYQAILTLVRGNYKDASLELEKGFKSPTVERDKTLKALIGYYLSMSYWYIGKLTEAVKISEEVLPLWENIEYQDWCNRVLEIISISYLNLGLIQQAVQYGKDLLISSQDKNDRVYQAWAHNHLGRAYLLSGRWHDSLYHLEESRNIWIDELWSDYGEAYPTAHIGLLLRYVSETEKSIEYLQKSMELATIGGSKEIVAYSHQNLAQSECDRSNYSRAIEHIERSIKLSDEMNNRYYQADSASILADIYIDMGQYEKAITNHKKCLEIANEIDSGYLKGKSLARLLALEMENYHTDLSINYEETKKFLETRKHYDFLSMLVFSQAKKLVSENKLDKALVCFSECFDYALRFNWYHLHYRTSEFLKWVEGGYISKDDHIRIVEHLTRYWQGQGTEKDSNSLLMLEKKEEKLRIENTHPMDTFIKRVSLSD